MNGSRFEDNGNLSYQSVLDNELWLLSNNGISKTISKFKLILFQSGVSIKNEKDFRILLNTHKAGQTTIKLKVEVADSSIQQVLEHAVLEDEIQIQVITIQFIIIILFLYPNDSIMPPLANILIGNSISMKISMIKTQQQRFNSKSPHTEKLKLSNQLS